jgi:hypothetical protein
MGSGRAQPRVNTIVFPQSGTYMHMPSPGLTSLMVECGRGALGTYASGTGWVAGGGASTKRGNNFEALKTSVG